MHVSVRSLMAILFFALALFCLIWAFFPFPPKTYTYTLPEVYYAEEDESQRIILPVGQVEAILTFPGTMPIGQRQYISLNLQEKALDDASNQPSPAIMEGFHFLIEAFIDCPDINLDPSGAMNQPFLQKGPLEFHWQVKAQVAGKISGRLWLHGQVVPPDGKPVQRLALLAVPFEIQAISLFGLQQAHSLFLGGGLLLASIILFIIGR